LCDKQRGIHDGIVALMSLCCNNPTISKRHHLRHRFPIDVISHVFASIFASA
jgi:hypothetical protein